MAVKNFGEMIPFETLAKKTLANPELGPFFSAHCIELRKLTDAARDTRSTIVHSWLCITRLQKMNRSSKPTPQPS